jgi:hypothetical protein
MTLDVFGFAARLPPPHGIRHPFPRGGMGGTP